MQLHAEEMVRRWHVLNSYISRFQNSHSRNMSHFPPLVNSPMDECMMRSTSSTWRCHPQRFSRADFHSVSCSQPKYNSVDIRDNIDYLRPSTDGFVKAGSDALDAEHTCRLQYSSGLIFFYSVDDVLEVAWRLPGVLLQMECCIGRLVDGGVNQPPQ